MSINIKHPDEIVHHFTEKRKQAIFQTIIGEYISILEAPNSSNEWADFKVDNYNAKIEEFISLKLSPDDVSNLENYKKVL